MSDSPAAPDGRDRTQRGTRGRGDTTHLPETCVPDPPHRITAVATTRAPPPARALTDSMPDEVVAKELLPAAPAVEAGAAARGGVWT